MITSLSTHLFVFSNLSDEILSLFPKYGFSHAEIWAMPPHFSYDETADRIAENMARHGIRIASLHGPIYPDIRTYKTEKWYSLGSANAEQRSASVEANQKAALWLARNGGGTVVLHTGFHSENWYPERWYSFLSSLEELVNSTPDNIRFAVENTPVDSGRSDIIHDIVARFPENRVGICIDVGHANIVETAQSAISTAGNRLIHIHASDNHGDKDDHLIPGDGNICWKTVMEELQKINFHGAFTLELRDNTQSDKPTCKDFEHILSNAHAALARILNTQGDAPAHKDFGRLIMDAYAALARILRKSAA